VQIPEFMPEIPCGQRLRIGFGQVLATSECFQHCQGDALFPRAYAQLTNELLEYAELEDPYLVKRLFDRRGQRRIEQARRRLAGLPFEDKVRTLATILDEDGYLADFTRRADGTYVITEHNCAVLSVAQRYHHACRSELDFLQAALPEADLRRIAHQLVAGHVCAYEVRPREDAGIPGSVS
jgi:DeoR family suf operon transcriptional repressor